MELAAKLVRLFGDDDAATVAIEYGLIAGLISVAIATVVLEIGVSLLAMYQSVADAWP